MYEHTIIKLFLFLLITTTCVRLITIDKSRQRTKQINTEIRERYYHRMTPVSNT